MALRLCFFIFCATTVSSQSWRRVFKLNRDVGLPNAPNQFFFDDSKVSYANIAEEEAWLATADGQSLNRQSYNFKSRIINDWTSNNLAVTKVRLSFTLGGAVQKSVVFSTTSPGEIFNRGSWFVKEKIESSSWSNLQSSGIWNTAAWYGINTGSWSNQRTFTVFDPSHGSCNDKFYFLVTVANWCNWERGSLANPKIMYSNLDSAQYGGDTVRNADSMIIEIYYPGVTTPNPSPAPTSVPTGNPIKDPTVAPSFFPSSDPTNVPTKVPTINPSADPTVDPTTNPTKMPTTEPTFEPTGMPSVYPSLEPTSDPTLIPSMNPTLPPIECEDDENAVLKVSFDYTLSDDSTSENAIISNLTEAAGIFIDSEFDDLTSCEVADYAIDVELISRSQAHINASICFNCTEGTDLDISIDSNKLGKDFKETVDGVTPILVVGTVDGITLVANEEAQVNDADTSTTNVNLDNTSDGEKSLVTGVEDMFLISVLTVIVSMLALVVCLLFVVYMVKKRKTAKDTEQEHMYKGHAELAKVVSMSDYPEERGSIDIEQHSVEMDGLIVTGSVALTPIDNGLNTPNAMNLMDLKQWLDGIGLIEYYDLFVMNGYGDDATKFRSLDDETLKNMGIKKMAHRKRILLDQINTEDFNFGEDKSAMNVTDDELYRRKSVKDVDGQETPAGATPKQSQHIVVPSEITNMTLNGVNQNVTDQGLNDIEDVPDEEDEGSGQEDESNDKMDDLLYQRPPANVYPTEQ